ncbi:phosphotransacetylase family protein [Cerasicoccus arenae]|uniref:Cobyrinic acid a,c-diamide synthase n=1 Tax=Cerasicoccus arenae TaxID=424488 RepID=A0A8J3DA38_9BACT|nr:AAA family ATPase [Cerasicoccus arenae]MBK1857541.1 AAA family ATPase [Cerasicoccus arenae]GHB95616.1 cobyrinic acid a,c-diamide synthase [Cerasicoccus arenae]
MPPKKSKTTLTSRPFPGDDDTVTLLSGPRNTTTKRIFVAATRQNDGKTTTCLGLYGAMRTRTPQVGFIKPVGQRFVEKDGHKVDEDSVLLDSIFDVQTPIDAMSPVAVDGTFTRRFLDNPDENLGILQDRISRAFDRSSYQKEVCIIEGSGHAGVGAVFDLSNAQVAKLLGAKAIIVAQGGIGRPVDEVAINKALFDKHGVEVIGAILNKVLPDKMDTVRKYAGEGLRRLGVPLLGVLPLAKQLAAPNLSQIVDEIGGRWINGREKAANERILRVVIGAMTAKGVIDYLQPGVLIITPGDRDDIIFAAIASAGISGKKVVSGIVLTRNILPHPKLMEMLAQTQIPCVICSEESYSVASRINSMTVKTQPQDTDKIPIIRNLILDHVDIDAIWNAF